VAQRAAPRGRGGHVAMADSLGIKTTGGGDHWWICKIQAGASAYLCGGLGLLSFVVVGPWWEVPLGINVCNTRRMFYLWLMCDFCGQFIPDYRLQILCWIDDVFMYINIDGRLLPEKIDVKH
jgi:hypothetical protein